jgi:hypothetical protein
MVTVIISLTPLTFNLLPHSDYLSTQHPTAISNSFNYILIIVSHMGYHNAQEYQYVIG